MLLPSRFAAATALLLVVGCGGHRQLPKGDAPADLMGEFVDDYGNRFVITPSEWTQMPHGKFHIRRWNEAARYLVARNDSANKSAPGLWTRIDWVHLEGMAPYTWAFCLSAYEAPTQAAAESTTIARKDTPRTGCNGFPFSRMRRPVATDRRPGS